MDWLYPLFERFGTLILFANTLLHELGVPIPLTPTVLVAGAASPQFIAVASLVVSVVAGSVIGNAIWFAAGRRFGTAILGRLCRLSLTPETCISKSGEGFRRWGAGFIILGRFLPGVALVAPPIAGALGMSWTKFLVLTAMGAALWALTIITIGAALQPAVIGVLSSLEVWPTGIWPAAFAVVVGYVIWRFAARRRAERVS